MKYIKSQKVSNNISINKTIDNYINDDISLIEFNNKIDKFINDKIDESISKSLMNFTDSEILYINENTEYYSDVLNEGIIGDKFKKIKNSAKTIGKNIIKSKSDYIKNLYKDTKKAVEVGKEFIKDPSKLKDKIKDLGDNVVFSVSSASIDMFKDLFSRDKEIRKKGGEKILETGKAIFIRVGNLLHKLLEHYKKHRTLYNIMIGVLIGGAAGIIISGAFKYSSLAAGAVIGGTAAYKVTKESDKKGKDAFKKFISEMKPTLKKLGITMAVGSICSSVFSAVSSGDDASDAFNQSLNNNTKIDITSSSSNKFEQMFKDEFSDMNKDISSSMPSDEVNMSGYSDTMDDEFGDGGDTNTDGSDDSNELNLDGDNPPLGNRMTEISEDSRSIGSAKSKTNLWLRSNLKEMNPDMSQTDMNELINSYQFKKIEIGDKTYGAWVRSDEDLDNLKMKDIKAERDNFNNSSNTNTTSNSTDNSNTNTTTKSDIMITDGDDDDF